MRIELTISGMVAVHAKHAVFAALAGVEGVMRAEVELGRAELELSRPEHQIDAVTTELRAAIAALGFTVTDIRRLARQLPTL